MSNYTLDLNDGYEAYDFEQKKVIILQDDVIEFGDNGIADKIIKLSQPYGEHNNGKKIKIKEFILFFIFSPIIILT